MSEYPVPQFIEEESKIIFFLTFRQFFIIVGGGLLCFLFYVIFPFALFAISAVIVAIIVVVVAFIKINNESVIKILLNFIGYSLGAKNYVWKKESYGIVDQNLKLSFKPQEYTKKDDDNSKLKNIKKVIEIRGDK